MRAALAAGLLLTVAAQAQAARWEFAGELRLAGVATTATAGQLGGGDIKNGCGQPSSDLGLGAGGVGVALLRTERYRYQLALGGGYYAFQCTPSLSRPVAGVDFRGDHRVTLRTRVSSTLRLQLDQFDRSMDIQTSGQLPDDPSNPGGPMDMGSNAGLFSGSLFFNGGGGLEVTHQLAGRHGLRAGLGVQTLQILAVGDSGLSPYRVVPLPAVVPENEILASLGPMEAGEVSLGWFWDTVRDRLELPATYRVSHFRPTTFRYMAGWAEVPASQDGSLSLAWERRPNPLWNVRLAAGLAATYQPNLCVQRGKAELEADSCSIDPKNPNIRAAEGAPPGELALGRRGTGTFIGELSVGYHDRKQSYEVALRRGYDPNAYIGALSLTDRLSGAARVRATRDLDFTAGVQLAHVRGSSPGQVLGADLQRVSPQNRTFLLAQLSAGVNWFLAGPVGLFALADFGAYGIRGEQVGDPQGQRQVAGFPAAQRGNPPMPTGDRYLSLTRFTFLMGVRVALRPSSREADLLSDVRLSP